MLERKTERLYFKQVTPKDDFDLSLFGGRKKSVSETDIAISEYLTALLQSLKLESRIIVGPEFIEIEWLPNESVGDPLESAMSLLRQGKYDEGIFLLRAVSKRIQTTLTHSTTSAWR